MSSDTEQIAIIRGDKSSNRGVNRTNLGSKPKTYLYWSILNLICSIVCIFGLIFSMASFVYSFKSVSFMFCFISNFISHF